VCSSGYTLSSGACVVDAVTSTTPSKCLYLTCRMTRALESAFVHSVLNYGLASGFPSSTLQSQLRQPLCR
jgi:hypothetical protein